MCAFASSLESHVGVAMGEGGSAMAVEAADLVIMSDNLLRISSTIELCRSSKSIIIQNCVFAVAIKIIAVILAGLGKNPQLSTINTIVLVLLTPSYRFRRDARVLACGADRLGLVGSGHRKRSETFIFTSI